MTDYKKNNVGIDSFDQTIRDVENDCQMLAQPILNRIGWRIVKKIRKQMINNDIDEDFAGLGLNFFDQMSIYYQSRTYDEMMFGFGDYIDELIDIEIESLSAVDRLVLECRDLHALSAGDMPAQIFSDVKNEFSSLVDQHYYTARIQRFVNKYDLHG